MESTVDQDLDDVVYFLQRTQRELRALREQMTRQLVEVARSIEVAAPVAAPAVPEPLRPSPVEAPPLEEPAPIVRSVEPPPQGLGEAEALMTPGEKLRAMGLARRRAADRA